MPIDLDGDKWACEACIRGHRSTKCIHFDRFMARVRRPGRPLSRCPHPRSTSNGSYCACKNEKVLMVRIPKDDGPCMCRPADPSRRQILINDRLYEIRGIDGCFEIPQLDPARPRSLAPANVANDQRENDANVDAAYRLTPSAQRMVNHLSGSDEGAPQTQLGMMGVGGFGAQDTIGWHGPWPNMQQASSSAAVGSVDPQHQQHEMDNGDHSFEASHFPATPPQSWNLGMEPGPQSGVILSAISGYDNGHAPNLDSCDCDCGDTCACFACPTHPGNSTTEQRAYELQEIIALERDSESVGSESRPQTAGTTNASATSWDACPFDTVMPSLEQESSDVPENSQNPPPQNGQLHDTDVTDSNERMNPDNYHTVQFDFSHSSNSRTTYDQSAYGYSAAQNGGLFLNPHDFPGHDLTNGHQLPPMHVPRVIPHHFVSPPEYVTPSDLQ